MYGVESWKGTWGMATFWHAQSKTMSVFTVCQSKPSKCQTRRPEETFGPTHMHGRENLPKMGGNGHSRRPHGDPFWWSVNIGSPLCLCVDAPTSTWESKRSAWALWTLSTMLNTRDCWRQGSRQSFCIMVQPRQAPKAEYELAPWSINLQMIL